jgi:hypothetical protein
MGRMQRMHWAGLVLALSISVGCSDEGSTNDGSSGTGGTAGAAGSAGSAGSSGSAGSAGSGGGPSSCGGGLSTVDLTGGSWDGQFTVAGFSSRYGIAPAVYDFARDTDGSLVVAGRFDAFAGTAVPPLMRWKDGAWQPALESSALPAADDGFSALAISAAGDLALATNDSFGERTGEIWVDDGNGVQTIGAFDGQVRSLAYFAGKLWVAGLFALDHGTTTIENLAVWDGTTWSASPGGAIDGVAFELHVSGTELWIAGAFTEVGGVAAENVARYDGTSFSAYDFPGALAIYAIAKTDGGALYAGGAFGEFTAPAGLARWSGTEWQVAGGGLAQFQTRGVVTDLVAHGEVVDATGCFNTAGGFDGSPGAIGSRSLARWDGAAWHSLDDGTQGVVTPWFQPMVCGDEALTAIWDVSHQRLAHEDAKLWAGGMFAGVDGVLSQALAAHDGSGWIAQGASGLGIGGSLDRVAAGGEACAVYGVGTFTHVAGVPAVGRVVRFDGASWKNFSDTLPYDAWCPDIDVSATGEVAVGCMVFPPTGDAEGKILRVDGDAMAEVPAPGLGPIAALEWSPSGTLWLGGSGIGGFLAKLEGSELTTVETGFDGGVALIDVAANDDIVVAGAFTTIGGVAANRVARWDGAAWSALGDGPPGQVLALARDGDATYVSTYDEGNGALLLGVFDGTSWTELATASAGLTPRPEFSFNALRPIEGGVLAAGTAELDDGSGRGLILFDGDGFSAPGGGLSAIGVSDVALTADSAWIAGSITAAGPDDSAVSSVGVARYSLPASR